MEKKYLIIFFFLVSNVFAETIIYDQNNFIPKVNCVITDTGITFYNQGRAEMYPNVCGCFHFSLTLQCEDDGAKLQIKKRNGYWIENLNTDGYWGIFEIDSLEHFRQQNPLVFDYWGANPLTIKEVKLERMICRPDTLIPDTLYLLPDSVRVAWDENTESDLEGYRVYWGNFAPFNYLTWQDVNLDTTIVIHNLDQNIYYWVSVTAYDTVNNESDFSFERKFILADSILEGDKNLDGIVDIWDQLMFDLSFGSTVDHILYDPFFDFILDGVIDIKDQYYFDNNCFGHIKE